MDWTAAHASFVTASYVVSAVCIAGLIARVFIRDARMKKTLAELEKTKS
jgi:heme exporter protein CcmD